MFIFFNSETRIRLLLQEQSDLGPHCLPLYISQMILAKINCRQLEQTAFSDEFFVGALRVKTNKPVQEILLHIV